MPSRPYQGGVAAPTEAPLPNNLMAPRGFAAKRTKSKFFGIICGTSLMTTYDNYGDVKPVGENVSELRFHFGPGYRIYFTERLGIIFFLLAGGTKKTQQDDIRLAKLIAAQI